VICSSVEEIHGFRFHGLGRQPMADPDRTDSYQPTYFFPGRGSPAEDRDRLLIPMDSRTTAGPTGSDEYAFYRLGGWSWSIPYIAGVYALSAQVDTRITPETFWALAMQTGDIAEIEWEGSQISIGPVISPGAIVGALRSGWLSDKKAVANAMEALRKTRNTSAPGDAAFRKKLGNAIPQMIPGKSSPQDVIALLGKPVSYLWGNKTFRKDNLPETYLMRYPDRFGVMIATKKIREVRIHFPGYHFMDKIAVGTPVEEVLAVLGQPSRTVTGGKNDFEDAVLYRDINGVKGNAYYGRGDRGVRMFFSKDCVAALYLTRTSRQ